MNVFDLVAKLSLDKSNYKKNLTDAEKEANTSGSKIGSLFNNMGAAVAAGITTAVSAASTAVVALGKEALENYASYEQLTGGVETLFKTSADTVMQYANNAYMTAGLSANDYMETVTSFSASLISSLGGDTKKAAEIADQAIVDMSDNANKMGSSMESIQNAYQGFAKQNYTMLDNLKLGYGGTAEEMKRLLSDAEALTGKKYDLSNFSDIVEAIHAIQEEMDIAGTTSREAATTIEGSINMVKASWQNLLTGLANEDADLTGLVDNFINSLKTAGENIIPAFKKAIIGGAQVLSELAPELATQVAALIPEVLPDLINAGVQLILGLAKGIGKAFPEMAKAGVQAITTICESLLDNTNLIVEAGVELAIGLAEGVIEMLPQILLEMLPRLLIATLKAIIITLPEALGEAFLEVLYEIGRITVEGIENLGPAIKNTWATMWDGVKDIGVSIIDEMSSAMSNSASVLGNIFTSLGDTLPSSFSSIKTAFTDLGTSLQAIANEKIPEVTNTVKYYFENLPELLVSVWNGVINGFMEWTNNMLNMISTAVPNLVRRIATEFRNLIEEMKQIGRNIIEGLKQGFTEKWDEFISKVKDSIEYCKQLFKELFGVHSPSRWAAWLGEMVVDGFTIGMDGILNPDKLLTDVNDSINAISATTKPVETTTAEATNNNYTVDNTVIVKLEGDAERLFRVIKEQNDINYRLTGNKVFA